MEELLKAGDYDGLAQHCEQEELKAPDAVPGPDVYSTLLGVYLVTNQLDHAKLLWQRIPRSVKQSNGELGELWEIGKRLWRRDFAAVYDLAQNPGWPPHISPLVTALVERVRERVLLLVSKAYSTIKAPELCALLGQSEEQVRQIASEKGWTYDSENSVYRPKPPVPDSAASQEHHERLQRLTDIVSFLEN